MEWYGDGGIHPWLISWQDTTRKSMRLRDRHLFQQRQAFRSSWCSWSQLFVPVIRRISIWNRETTHGCQKWKGSLALDHWNQMNPQVSRGTPSHFGLHFKHHLRCDDLTRKYCYGHCSNCSKRGPSMYSSHHSTSILAYYIYTYPSQQPSYFTATIDQRPLPEGLYEHVGSRHACRST